MRAYSSNLVRQGFAGSMLTMMLIALISAFVMSLSQPAPAEAQLPGLRSIPGVPNPCDLLPDGASESVCNGVTDPAGTAVGQIPGVPTPSEIVGSAADAIVTPILNGIVKAEAAAVAAVLTRQVEFINSTTTPNLDADWFLRQYSLIFGMAVFIALVTFLTRFARATMAQNPAEMGRAGFSMVAFLVFGSVLPAIVGGLVYFFDAVLAPEWMELAGQDANKTLDALSDQLVESYTVTGISVPILIPLLILAAGVIGGVIMELLLFFREGLLYLMVPFAVVALALWVGGRWSSGLFKKVMMGLVALIVFKFLAAFIFTTSIFLIGDAEDGIEAAILGSVMLLLMPIALIWSARIIAQTNVQFQVNQRFDTLVRNISRFKR